MLARKESINPSFTYGNEVNQICQGIFRRFNLNAFSYSKVYPDGSRAELWTDVKALNHSFFLKQYIHQVYTPDLFKGQKFVLYDITVNSFPSHLKERLKNQLKDQRELFGHANCLFLIDYHPQYTEYFAFYTTPTHTNAVNSYLNNRDQLTRFCKYFLKRARKLIQDADNDKLILPWRDKHTGMKFTDKKQRAANHKPPPLVDCVHKPNVLSPRENEISDLLCEGIDAKQIANLLFISRRTVEKHIENIKAKLGCKNRCQLLKHLITDRL